MKSVKYIAFCGLLLALSTNYAFASCSNSGYGSNNCDNNTKDYTVDKKVSKANSDTKQDKILNVKKGDNFIFTFKIQNNTNEDVTLNLVDNLPAEFEKVSGIGFTEDVRVAKKSSETVKMVAKVKDSEFVGKSNFEKCVVNKAYIYKSNREKDSGTATVCYGDGTKAISLPKTGSDTALLGFGLLTSLLGFGLKKFRN